MAYSKFSQDALKNPDISWLLCFQAVVTREVRRWCLCSAVTRRGTSTPSLLWSSPDCCCTTSHCPGEPAVQSHLQSELFSSLPLQHLASFLLYASGPASSPFLCPLPLPGSFSPPHPHLPRCLFPALSLPLGFHIQKFSFACSPTPFPNIYSTALSHRRESTIAGYARC